MEEGSLPIFQFEEGEEVLACSLVNYLGKQLSTNKLVPGRIGDPQFYPFWRDILKAPEFVLSTIRGGYIIPFLSEPPSSFLVNNSSCLKNSDFAFKELLRLEELGVISRVPVQPYIVLPLSVMYSKKLRLVVDASRTLNPWVQDRHIN